MLHFERSRYCMTLDPNNVYLFNRFQRCRNIIERSFVEQRTMQFGRELGSSRGRWLGSI